MAIMGWLVVAAILVFGGIVVYAMYQRRDVKAGLKIPFAAFFFEIMYRNDDPLPPKKQIKNR